MFWAGTPSIGGRPGTTYGGCGSGSSRRAGAGDLKKVRNLQKLMLRSRANALLSVRRVTEVNAGRKTAGVDGRIVLGGREKIEMASWLQHGTAAWRPRPVKRVFIPKSGGKRRGLGIPVIADRALQVLAILVIWRSSGRTL